MRKIQNPLDRSNPSIENRITSQPQEEPQKKDEKPPCDSSKNLTLSILGSIAFFLGRQLDALSVGRRKKAITKENRKILENLLAFKKLLSTITEIDQSYNPEFIQKMSEVWNDIISDYYYFKTLADKNILHLSKLNELIQIINSFPKNEEHSLGYYLTEYVGKKWLPFPFIHCMQLLHEDHVQRPMHSYLQEILFILNEVISAPNPK